MDTQSLPLVNFGKYKGKSVLDLLADRDYVEYLKTQRWFSKFTFVYNIVVNQTITTSNQNSKTPEHNKFQNIFLDNENVEKLWNNIIINKYCKSTRHKPLKLNSYKIEFEGIFNWDCIFVFNTFSQCLRGPRCCSNEFDITELFVFSDGDLLSGDAKLA
jgi:hypothetical protein